jgi:4-carboxymuconolactone decarboxylase
MSRIDGITDGAGGPKVRLAYRLIRPSVGGRVPTSMRLAARRPGVLWGTGLMELANQRGLRLPGRLIELTVLKSASELGCPFCLDIGSWVARTRHGVTDEELIGLQRHHDAPCFSDADRAAFDLAVAMTTTPATADGDEALWTRLRTHFDDDQIVELTHIIAWENYRSRFNLALGLQPDGFSDGAACAVVATTPAVATVAAS